jgi:membrane-bound lytic murein transglycosylase D
MRKLVVLFMLVCGASAATIPQVPSKMDFAGIRLNIKPAAQKKIQTYVNQLRKSQKHHQAVVDKADLCFPLIERVFKEEGFPEDFKYLIIQETGFRATAVSKSNAVGYWQFKVAAGEEVGLKINKAVDERMNLASSSRGAAHYVTKNNKKLDNWVYALLSYNVGPGGVMNHFKEKDRGVKKMDISGNMHWYVLKLLAHKVAFQDDIKKNESKTFLFIDKNQGGKKLVEIAKSYDLELTDMTSWNEWLKAKKVPQDKVYEVIVPIRKSGANIIPNVVTLENPVQEEETVVLTQPEELVIKESVPEEVEELSIASVENQEVVIDPFSFNHKAFINGVEGMVAKTGDNANSLALKGGITLEEFLRFNDLKNTKIEPGQTYFFHMKKSKAKASYHMVLKGETVWSISQHYGVTSRSILKKNRLRNKASIKVGDRLFLRSKKPKIIFETIDKETVVLSSLTHSVKSGDTLYSLSKKYDVSVDQIKRLNGLLDNTLAIGQVLKIR